MSTERKPFTVKTFGETKAVVELEHTEDKRTVSVRGRQVVLQGEFSVYLDGELIGEIEHAMVTRERKSQKRMYVSSRWQSPGWTYRTPHGRWINADGKSHAILQLILFATTVQ